MSENKQLTPEQIDEMASICSHDPQAYRRFVASLTSPPETYNLSHAVLGGLVEALHRLTSASLELDHFKRALTYGEKLRINPPAQYWPINRAVRSAEAAIEAGLEGQLPAPQRDRLLLIHGVLGKITEAMELAPILVDLILDHGDVDLVNLIEELGDDAFYTALVEQALPVMPGNVVYRNVQKLGKRYKGGAFTRDGAINRDLGAEREALEESDDLLGEDQ